MRKRLNLSGESTKPNPAGKYTRVNVDPPVPMSMSTGHARIELLRDDSEPKKVKLEPRPSPIIEPSIKVDISLGIIDDIARRCMSAFVMNYKGVSTYEAAWVAIFREAAQLHACIRGNPLVNAHLLYTRCLSDLRYEIRMIEDDESPMRAVLEESIPRRSYSITEGPRSDIMKSIALGYHVVKHPFRRLMIFHPKCVN